MFIDVMRPPLNELVLIKASWYSYSTDGDARKHDAEWMAAIRYDDYRYSILLPKGNMRDQRVYHDDVLEWQPIEIPE